MTTVWVHTYYASPLLYSPTFYGILNITIQEVSTWSGHVYMQDDKRRQESKCVCVITDDGPIQQCYTTSSNNSAIFSTADPSISYTCMIEQHQQMHKPILQLFLKLVSYKNILPPSFSIRHRLEESPSSNITPP